MEYHHFSACTNKGLEHVWQLYREYLCSIFFHVLIVFWSILFTSNPAAPWQFIFLLLLKQILGRTGRVQKVYVDGDLRITVGKHVWTINPVSCALVRHNPAPPPENKNTTHEADDKGPKREDPSGKYNDKKGNFIQAYFITKYKINLGVENLFKIKMVWWEVNTDKSMAFVSISDAPYWF